MSETLALLSLTNTAALQQLVQDALIEGVSVDDLLIAVPVAGTGLEMTAKVYVDGDAYEKPDWPYFGNVDFSYTRLDLQNTFGTLGLWFKINVPFHTNQIAALLTQALDIHFDSDDFFHEIINNDVDTQFNFAFKAGVTSRRWKGQVNVQIRRNNPLPVEGD